MANLGKIQKIKVNNDIVDLKDELLSEVVTSTPIGASTTADDIKAELTKAVEGNSSSNKKTIKQLLADLKSAIDTASSGGITDVRIDSSTGKLQKKVGGSGSWEDATSKANIVTGLRDSVTSSNAASKTSSTSGFTTPQDAWSLIEYAQLGAAIFQGTTDLKDGDTVTSGHWKFSTLSDYKKGNYWVVATAGTYVGETCEAGDFIYCVSDKGSSYSASDFKVVQANIDLSEYATLASPAFTGTPTAPTATAGTSTTQIATTAFVQNAIGTSYTYISQEIGASGSPVTGKFASDSASLYNSVYSAYNTNKKVAIIGLKLKALNDTIVPILMLRGASDGTTFTGSNIIRTIDQPGGSGTHNQGHEYIITVSCSSSGYLIVVSEPIHAEYNSSTEVLSLDIPMGDGTTDYEYAYAPTVVSNS